MSKTRFVGTIVMLAFVLVLMTGCGADPVTVAQQFQEAVNSQDVESALKLLAKNASMKAGETSSVTGKDQIANWLATQAELHYQFNGDPIASESRVTFENCSINSYQWSYYAIKAMSGTCEVTVEDELVTEFAVQFDEDSKASLADSSVAAAADMIGIWITKNYLTDSGDLYLQFFEDGSSRLASTPDDLLITPDSDHQGASITWTYEDYVLILQNDGVASEGYCQEQDVGKFLVKNADGGGLIFKTIDDSCSLRGVAFQLPPRWRPYVP